MVVATKDTMGAMRAGALSSPRCTSTILRQRLGHRPRRRLPRAQRVRSCGVLDWPASYAVDVRGSLHPARIRTPPPATTRLRLTDIFPAPTARTPWRAHSPGYRQHRQYQRCGRHAWDQIGDNAHRPAHNGCQRRYVFSQECTWRQARPPQTTCVALPAAVQLRVCVRIVLWKPRRD